MDYLGCLVRQKRIYISILLVGIALVVFLTSSLHAKQALSSHDKLDASFVLALKSREQVAKESDIYKGDCLEEIWLLEDAGRLGNKFLEFMNARVVATFQNKELFVTDEFYNYFLRYFTGLRAAAIAEKHIWFHCKLPRNMWKEISPEYFVDKNRLLVPMEYRYVRFIAYPLNITSITWSIMFRHREILLDEFKFKDDFMAKVKLRISEVTKGITFSTLVGIHVRRTDFYDHMIDLYGHAKTADSDYFERAKAIYKQRYGNPLFMVVSDDLAWCTENLRAPDVVFPGHGNQDDPGWDFAFLASCDHLILTYGTFGVAAAYFCRGDVIIADNFTGKPNDLNERLRNSNSTNWTWLPV